MAKKKLNVFRNVIPLNWLDRHTDMYQFNGLMALFIWNKVIDAGYDPTEPIMKFQEIGDGRLAVGFFKNKEDNFNRPIKGLGFIVPMGFWYTTDDRMPLNWMGKNPPAGYGPPGIGKPVDPIYYQIAEGSSNL